MDRRDFIAGAVLSVPFAGAGRAQSSKNIPVIAVLWHGTKERELANPYYHWFREGFAKAGYRIDVDLIIRDYFADESDEKYNVLSPAIVAQRPDVLVAVTGPPAVALKKVQGNLPLVFVSVADPIGMGIVSAFGRHPENITGISNMGYDVPAKRAALLKEAVPTLSRLAVIVNPKSSYNVQRDVSEYREIGQKLGFSVEGFNLADDKETDTVFRQIVNANCDGVALSQNPMFALMGKELAGGSIATKLPMICHAENLTAAGVMMSYAADYSSLFQSTAGFIKKVLAGERPADIPVDQPNKFDLVINQRTANLIGLTLPPSLLARASRIIE